MSPGEKRRRAAKRERERVAYEAAMQALRAAGASCGSCAHFGRMPLSKERTCDLDSDFGGYAITTADHLCPRHKERSHP